MGLCLAKPGCQGINFNTTALPLEVNCRLMQYNTNCALVTRDWIQGNIHRFVRFGTTKSLDLCYTQPWNMFISRDRSLFGGRVAIRPEWFVVRRKGIGRVPLHYGDVITGAIASQITSLTIVYSTVYSDADQRKHQSSASLAFMRGIHRGPVNSPHKWPVTRKMFPFDDVIMQQLVLLICDCPQICLKLSPQTRDKRLIKLVSTSPTTFYCLKWFPIVINFVSFWTPTGETTIVPRKISCSHACYNMKLLRLRLWFA